MEENFITLCPGAKVIKLFIVIIYNFLISWSVCPGKPFRPSLMFVGKAEAYPFEEPFRYSTLR